MQKDAIEEIRNRKKRMAICYDFDKTLSPDDMQAFTLIPSLEMDKSLRKESKVVQTKKQY